MTSTSSTEPTTSGPTPDREAVGRRNLWAVSWTSFFTDVSSQMVFHLLPLYLTGVVGVKANVVGLVEGAAASVASLVKLYAGGLSDRLGARKRLAVAGYAISALAKPLFALATTWGQLAAVRWTERVGKGIRTAPRDALLADGASRKRRGLVFGVHRAADTAGAVVGLGLAIWLVGGFGGLGAAGGLTAETFRRVVYWSLAPAFLAVVILVILARDLPSGDGSIDAKPKPAKPRPAIRFRGLGKRFAVFLGIVALFDLGNSADAFLVLRAAEQGIGVGTILAMVLVWNVVYAATSAPGGWLSDRFGRRPVLAAGWLLYGTIYLGFALVDRAPGSIWGLFALYGVYHGLTHGTAKAMVADLVPADERGTAYGTYACVLGLIDLPASVLAGVLWHGAFGWHGLGGWAPFAFGAACALLAAIWLLTSSTLSNDVAERSIQLPPSSGSK
ncbi:MAG: MFS transporter [Acidobacteriota bacterium]